VEATPVVRAHTREMASPVKVLIPLATGSEELEAIALANVLRRGGVEVTLATTEEEGGLAVVCARKTKILCDAKLSELVETGTEFGMIVLPGGMPGAERLGRNVALVEMLRKQRASGGWYGAICAAPAVALKPNGLFPKTGTCYPSFKEKIGSDVVGIDDRVVVDHDAKCATSQGPGTAIEFGLSILNVLVGAEAADQVKSSMLVHAP